MRDAHWKAELSAHRQRCYVSGHFRRRTLADELRDGAAAYPGVRVVFHSDERPAQATLGEMHRRSRSVAAGLADLGLGPGDVVAIQVPNWLEGALAFQAAMTLGVVVLPIVHIYGPAEVGFILRQSGARALICPDRWRRIDYLERLDRLDRSALPALEHVIVIGQGGRSDTLDWVGLEARTSEGGALPAVDPDDVCLLIYTSGTTAEPKGVQHTHNTVLAEARSIRRVTGDGRPASNLSAFPAGHIAAVLGLLRLYLHGGPSVLMDAWDPDVTARLIEAHRVTHTAGTPFHLASLLDAAKTAARDLSSLQGYLIGAASVPPALVERADAAGIPTYRSYGSSEHPTISSGSAGDPLERRAATDGRLLVGNEVRILDDHRADLPPGREGEIASRGPELFAGYRDAALNRDAFLPGGWFLTGDIGVLDAQEFLRITDRKKDVIIRGGENIASKEVEDVLARHAAVQEAAVVAMPDERYGERVCAWVVLRPGAELDLGEVSRHFAAEGVARQKTPERLETTDDLPRTAAGKVQKFELRRRLREGT